METEETRRVGRNRLSDTMVSFVTKPCICYGGWQCEELFRYEHWLRLVMSGILRLINYCMDGMGGVVCTRT